VPSTDTLVQEVSENNASHHRHPLHTYPPPKPDHLRRGKARFQCCREPSHRSDTNLVTAESSGAARAEPSITQARRAFALVTEIATRRRQGAGMMTQWRAMCWWMLWGGARVPGPERRRLRVVQKDSSKWNNDVSDFSHEVVMLLVGLMCSCAALRGRTHRLYHVLPSPPTHAHGSAGYSHGALAVS
jgi:hypothetical protein